MSRLSASHRDLIARGNTIKQTWAVLSPIASGSTTYITYTFEQGFNATTPTQANRVTRAGSRKVAVWNPHPQDKTSKAKAPRYSFEVSNADGRVYPGNGSIWNNFGIYDAAPEECLILHSVLVDLYGDGVSYQQLPHLAYTGRVVSVQYAESADPGGDAAGNLAVITCEQTGAWDTLRRVFTKDDGDDTLVDVDGIGTNLDWTV